MTVALAYLGMSLAAFVAMGTDKRRARRGGRRISERTLHTLEAFGGFPGSFAGQRTFRHKTRKRPYQAVFWLIVLLHTAFWACWFIAR